jgi:hypothetical protein
MPERTQSMARLAGVILGLSPAVVLAVTSCFVTVTNLTCCGTTWTIQCSRENQFWLCTQTRTSSTSYTVSVTEGASPGKKGRVALQSSTAGDCTYDKRTCGATVGMCAPAVNVTEQCVSTTAVGNECTGS